MNGDRQCADCGLTDPTGVTFESWAKPPRALCGAHREEAHEIVFGRLESPTGERPNALAAREPVRGAFALDVPDDVPAIWGEGDQVVMAAGEPLFVCAPSGVGKTTPIGQFALARAGVLPPTLLGLAIRPDDRSVLYIAADRPAQIARSMRRMVDEQHRAQLDARLKVRRGPLSFNVVDDPARLAAWVAELASARSW